jgi:hypothetical protein
MRFPNPLRTLAVGATVAAALLAANMVVNRDDSGSEASAAGAAPVAATASPTQASPTQASPTPTPTAVPTPSPTIVEPLTIYTGPIKGSGLTAALEYENGQAAAYICDGAAKEFWLRGTAVDGVLTLDGDGVRLVAVYNGQRVVGAVSVDGRQWSFRAAPAPWPTWAPAAPSLGS